jgi:uncharacterized protein YndB with AHSA1/START domain
VGTITDVHPPLRLLLSRAGDPQIGESSAFSFNDPAGMCRGRTAVPNLAANARFSTAGEGKRGGMAENHLQLTAIPDVKVEMLVRRPPPEVFQAFVDPDITTQFWFTRSSGKMTPGVALTWDWEMYGVSAEVLVKEIEEDRRILFQWADEMGMTVELRFTPWDGGATHVEVTESGFRGDGDEVVTYAANSTGGFNIMLCALKALLEQGIDIAAVRDAHPRQLRQ